MGQRALFCRSYGHYPADGRRLAAFPVQVLEQEAVLCGQCLPFGGAVQKSLMPKGVDHTYLASPSVMATTVQKSLMPKGVDHG
jgi:hypothetical protein